jgi:hypothetical protein
MPRIRRKTAGVRRDRAHLFAKDLNRTPANDLTNPVSSEDLSERLLEGLKNFVLAGRSLPTAVA